MIRKILIQAGLILLTLSCVFAADPNNAARELLTRGHVDEAISAIRTHQKTNPQDAESYFLLCRAYGMVQRWDDAISNCERATSLQPNNSDFHMWLGRTYGEKADRSNFVTAIDLAKKVRQQFETAVQLNGGNAAARADLSEFYVDAPGFIGGGKDKARAQADQLARFDPASAHWVRATIAEKEKKYDVAERELKAAIDSSSVKAKAWVDLASFYRRRGRANEMQDAVSRAESLAGRQNRWLFEGAQVLSSGGRNFAGAVKMLRTYIQNGPYSDEAPVFEAHYLLGTLLEKLGDRNGAAQEYRTALSLAHGFQKAQTALARLK